MLQVPIFVPVIVFLFSLTIVIVPFTIGVPRKEFLFSVIVAGLSVIGFLPFGKAKKFMKSLGENHLHLNFNKTSRKLDNQPGQFSVLGPRL